MAAEEVHESAVLKKLDASVKADENRWPIFPLQNVVISSQVTGNLMSLIAAHKGERALINGVLHEREVETRSLLRARNFGRQKIYIKDVSMYSYGKFDDGTLAFWAAGEAGWFEIRSCKSPFNHVYDKMGEATEMLYYLVDKVNNQRKDFSKATAKEIDAHVSIVFGNFNDSPLNKFRATRRLCHAGFVDHRHFLIKCMIEGAENVNWKNSPFLKWYQRHYPSEVADLTRIVFQIPNNIQVPQATQTYSSRGSPAVGEVSEARGRRSTRLAHVQSEEEGNSSGDPDNSRHRARDEHKAKSMLRPKGAKTPSKCNMRREGLRAIRHPSMNQLKQTMDLAEPEEDKDESKGERLAPNVVSELKFTEIDRDGKPVPTEEYWEPKGPDETWTCPYDGCNHQVWEAKTPAGVLLIKQHYARTHRNSIEELVISEERPWAKVSYLLEKVRSLQAEAKIPVKDGDSKPKRIVRRY